MITIVDHPLIKRDLSILRDRETPHGVFRSILERISAMLAYEATRQLPLREIEIQTPLQATQGHVIDASVCVVSILRAGLGMVDGILHLIPDARQGHIGMYRNETTHQPVPYYKQLPSGMEKAHILLVDPMLATGGSAIYAMDQLKKDSAGWFTFVCLIAAQEGIDALCKAHPDVQIVTAALDRELDENAFILPGLGDAGDRTFGT